MTTSEFMVFVWPWIIVAIQWFFVFFIMKEWRRTLDGWRDSFKIVDGLIKLADEVITHNEELTNKIKQYENAKSVNKTPVQDSSV